MANIQTFERPRTMVSIMHEHETWLQMLATACNTVRCQAGDLVAATSVNARFDGLSLSQRHDFLELARRLAGEYGLDAEVNDTGTHLEARFSRKATEPPPAHQGSLLRNLRGSVPSWGHRDAGA